MKHVEFLYWEGVHHVITIFYPHFNYNTVVFDSMDKLKELIETEKRRNPKEFIDAERKGELLHYLEKALKKANINPALLNQYCKEQIPENGVLDQIESFVQSASFHLDDTFYEPFYQHNLPSNNMGIADVMAAFRTNSKIIKPLKRIKVFCALSSLFFFGIGIQYGMRRWIPHAILFLGLSADLFRISYNCYDKKYCSLYLHMIGGNVSKLTDTIFKFAKSVVGISEPEDDPLLRLRTEIVWRNLLEDTILQFIYHKVGYAICECY